MKWGLLLFPSIVISNTSFALRGYKSCQGRFFHCHYIMLSACKELESSVWFISCQLLMLQSHRKWLKFNTFLHKDLPLSNIHHPLNAYFLVLYRKWFSVSHKKGQEESILCNVQVCEILARTEGEGITLREETRCSIFISSQVK